MIFREHFLAQKSDKSPHLCDPIFYVRFFGSLPILYSTWTFTVTHFTHINYSAYSASVIYTSFVFS